MRPPVLTIVLGSNHKDSTGDPSQRQVWFIPLADERGVCR